MWRCIEPPQTTRNSKRTEKTKFADLVQFSNGLFQVFQNSLDTTQESIRAQVLCHYSFYTA